MNIRTYILSIATLAFLASCSTNQDLVQLDEYDDLYYTPAPQQTAAEAYDANQFLGANSAESSYYGESPYVDESEKPSSEFEEKAHEESEQESEDYYDPDYATRIENFHRDGNQDYVYSDAFANNMNPRFYGSMNMNSFNGFNRFGFGMGMGPGMGMGMGMGNPWMGNRWCDPFFDPFCNYRPWGRPGFGMNMGWGSTWGMYDPFSPWYNPYMAYNPYGYGWGNPYGFNPYGYNPYYGPGVIIVDGSGGNSRGFQNTPRSGSSSRNSRGGVVGSSSDRRGTTQGDDGPKSNTGTTGRDRSSIRSADENRTRPVRSSTDTDYYNRNDSRSYQSDGINRSTRNRIGNENDRTVRERQVTSPYTRQRERQNSTQQTPDYSRYNRSNTNNNNSTRDRSRNTNSYSSPTRSRNTTPSMSTPTRSRSTTTSPRTSSPSRSSGGGSRRR
ncbi:MAG TPA: hypothetical protein VJ949_11255 [Cryomorphaceae bacterium]|nr:hypothetical protein [Cryomorphaceae bacterium]